jgi:uncharacterized membrane protein YwaF
VLVVIGRAHRGTVAELRFRLEFALPIPCFTVPMQVLSLIPAHSNVATSLPLHLCDLAYGQGIHTPSLTDRFPDPQYFMFWECTSSRSGQRCT